MKYLVDIRGFIEDDLQSSAFPWMRSTEAREQLLKKNGEIN